jgi:hypothetical protein
LVPEKWAHKAKKNHKSETIFPKQKEKDIHMETN